VDPVGSSGKTAGKDQIMMLSSDMGWLTSTDRMDFTFKKRVDKIDWRKIGKCVWYPYNCVSVKFFVFLIWLSILPELSLVITSCNA
jgi:hypothetical protein